MLHKIILVLRREYITRVRKKSFIVMTVLAPLLIAIFYGIIIYFAVNRDIGETHKIVFVNDKDGLFTGKLKDREHLQFTYGKIGSGEQQKQMLDESAIYAVLNIPDSMDQKEGTVILACSDQPGLNTVSYIEDQLLRVVKDRKLKQFGINETVIASINKTNIHIETIKSTSEGFESSSTVVSTAIGFISAMLIYFFIFLYGVQVMQGVIEEKTNRIVEVIISSLRPFELMMGKIIGIALVGLTQFVIWMVLVTVFGTLISGSLMGGMNLPSNATGAIGNQGGDLGNILEALGNYNYPLIIGMFLFYFIAGYLFYGSLFAAVGSAVDNETDKQQFMLPITMPLIFAIVMAQSAVVANPHSSLSFWLSVIPFTSPIIMMVRMPFGVPAWEIVVSMICMVAGFVFTVWIAGRIYRIGILMYGKKPSYKEIGKWLFYKG